MKILTLWSVKSQLVVLQSTPLQMQLPDMELLRDLLSGKTVFRTIMGIFLPGVDATFSERTNHIDALFLEIAVLLFLEIIILVLEKDLSDADSWSKSTVVVQIL